MITHLLNIGDSELYRSVWTWAGAVAISGFGLVLELLAASGWLMRTLWGLIGGNPPKVMADSCLIGIQSDQMMNVDNV